MSGSQPSLDDYFARARNDRAAHNEATLALLAEYRAKAERRRRRRIVAVTAFSCAMLGVLGLEFLLPPAALTPSGAVAISSRSPAPVFPGTTETPPALSFADSASGHRSPVSVQDATGGAPRREPHTPTASVPGTPKRDTRALAVHETWHAIPVEPAVGTDTHPTAMDISAVAALRTAALPVDAAALDRPAIRFRQPDATLPAVPLVDPATDAEPRTLGLAVGVQYGTAAADLAPINEQLASLELPTLQSQFRQTTIQAGIALADLTVGVAYTLPVTESVSGRLQSPDPLVNLIQPSLTTTFAQERWSVYSEYALAITDALRLDAGAQLSVTAYDLAFAGNYDRDPGTLPVTNNEVGTWERLWEELGTPTATTDYTEQKNGAAMMQELSTRSIGISPMVGVSWRALPTLNLQCRFRYLFNVSNEWRDNTTGAPVNGAGTLLRLNEYSISIGASFYHWLF